VSPTYYANYRDDGPSGPCGQSMAITSPWNQLFIFPDRASYIAWEHGELEKRRNHRKNARIDAVWIDDPEMYAGMAGEGDVIRMSGQEGVRDGKAE
jgi:hypothetical protein